MLIIFKKAGKYKSTPLKTVLITKEDVADEKVFNINDSDAIIYIDVNKAVKFVQKKEPEKKNLNDDSKEEDDLEEDDLEEDDLEEDDLEED